MIAVAAEEMARPRWPVSYRGAPASWTLWMTPNMNVAHESACAL